MHIHTVPVVNVGTSFAAILWYGLSPVVLEAGRLTSVIVMLVVVVVVVFVVVVVLQSTVDTV